MDNIIGRSFPAKKALKPDIKLGQLCRVIDQTAAVIRVITNLYNTNAPIVEIPISDFAEISGISDSMVKPSVGERITKMRSTMKKR